MKAIVYQEYGSPDALSLREVPTPTPREGEVLIAVRATGLNAADRYLLRGRPAFLRLSSGLRRPKNPILGADVAGEVVAVGSGVTSFTIGEAVYGDLSGCGLGGLAEYVCAPAELLARPPANLTAIEAAAVPMAGVTALQALRDKGRVQPGQRVLLYGASGGVGTFAVQLARALGAEVTAVCSPRHHETAAALGAARVFDYSQAALPPDGYDLILAINGYRPLREYRQAVAPGGIVVVVGGAMRQIFGAMLLGPLAGGGRTVSNLMARPNSADLAFLTGLMEAGQVRPVVERCYPLAETAAAFRALEQAHARGKVVISVAG